MSRCLSSGLIARPKKGHLDTEKTIRGYFRAKLAQERLIAESPIPYSIVHATQFFEFVKNIADECLGDFALIELLRVGWHTAH